MTNNWYEDYRVRQKSHIKDIEDERLEDDHTFDELFELRANPNRIMAFWGNLCGMLASFFISQAEKYGDYYETNPIDLIKITTD